MPPRLSLQRPVRSCCRQASARVLLLLWTGIGWPFLWEVRVPGQYWAAFERQQHASMQALARPFPPSVAGTVDAIPWETAELMAFRSRLSTTPGDPEVFHLTRRGCRHSTAIISKAHVPRNAVLADRGHRWPAADAGDRTVFTGHCQWYDAVDTDPRGLGLILHRRSAPRSASQQAIGETELHLDQWVTIPQPETGLVLARVTLPHTWLGRIATFLYREPLLLITVRSGSVNERTYRFIPGMAELGFAISPLPIADPGSPRPGLLDQGAVSGSLGAHRRVSHFRQPVGDPIIRSRTRGVQ